MCEPEVIVLAVDAAILLEARQLGLQLHAALAALEAAGVPLALDGAQVELVQDAQPAAGAQGNVIGGRQARGGG